VIQFETHDPPSDYLVLYATIIRDGRCWSAARVASWIMGGSAASLGLLFFLAAMRRFLHREKHVIQDVFISVLRNVHQSQSPPMASSRYLLFP
jgi:hypothetical protein